MKEFLDHNGVLGGRNPSTRQRLITLLWNSLTKHRQRQFLLILILMVIVSFTEVVSIGAVLPFLGVLTAPEQVYHHALMQPIILILDLSDPTQMLLPFTVMFILAVLITGTIRIALLYIMTRFSFAVGADISIEIYRRSLYQEYPVHISRNSSEIIDGILTKTNTVIYNVLNPILIFVSSIVIVISVTAILFLIDFYIALVASIGFIGIYWIVIIYTRQQLEENSKCIATKTPQVLKSLQEGIGGIRDVLIDGSQEFYCWLYKSADIPMRRASGNNQFISTSPRYAIEAIGMVLIAALAYIISLRENGLDTAIPILGSFALGAQRLLPSLQQAYSSYSNIKGAKRSLLDVLALLSQPLTKHYIESPIHFEREINLRNISFRYNDSSQMVLKNINLTIKKGNRVGFIGKTGSGKSTLLDIVMGLLPPTVGELIIDNQTISVENQLSWRLHIAHVPQNIYLSDSTIEENIAFGIHKKDINSNKVRFAAKQAQLSELIDKWEEGYQTVIGECGVRLSGGQRQRIAIARALYKEADVLIFDEATSALDNDTEKAVMSAINGLGRNLTILIIAHRHSTLKGCDSVFEVSKDGVRRL